MRRMPNTRKQFLSLQPEPSLSSISSSSPSQDLEAEVEVLVASRLFIDINCELTFIFFQPEPGRLLFKHIDAEKVRNGIFLGGQEAIIEKKKQCSMLQICFLHDCS
jgi:hypothetical protein